MSHQPVSPNSSATTLTLCSTYLARRSHSPSGLHSSIKNFKPDAQFYTADRQQLVVISLFVMEAMATDSIISIGVGAVLVTAILT